jgi:hypothetical protein
VGGTETQNQQNDNTVRRGSEWDSLNKVAFSHIFLLIHNINIIIFIASNFMFVKNILVLHKYSLLLCTVS